MKQTVGEMHFEDQLDAIRRVLTAPLPISGDRRVLLEKRVELVLAVIAGTVHPIDVQMAPLASIDELNSSIYTFKPWRSNSHG